MREKDDTHGSLNLVPFTLAQRSMKPYLESPQDFFEGKGGWSLRTGGGVKWPWGVLVVPPQSLPRNPTIR